MDRDQFPQGFHIILMWFSDDPADFGKYVPHSLHDGDLQFFFE